MAKFNTLAGGYYGKLGATVGQRWKNIRTVRAYVIPHNPQTEVQQANRQRFSDCVFYAQLAGQMNAKVTAFDTTSKTLWNARMSTARALQDLGYSEMDRLPLYPTTFSVPNIISAATITQVVDETHIQVTVEGIAPTEERVLTMLLLLPGAESWKDRLALCIGSNGEQGGNIFTFRLPEGLTIPNGTKARFVSCDDTDSLTDLIASAQINLPIAAPEHHTFDTSITSVERSGNNFTFTFGEDYQSGDNSITVASLKGVVNGAITTVSNPSVSLINNGGKFAMVYTSEATDNQDLIAFPNGSEIVISEIKSWSSTVHADAENATESFSSTDLTRTYKNTISGVTRSDSTYTFAISRAVPTITTKSGAVTGRAVVNGAFANIALTGYTLDGSSLVWASGITDSQDLPAFPSGSTITMNTVIVGNGVTYNPETETAQSVTSTDLTRTYKNTISGVTRSDSTYTFAISRAVPTITTKSGAVTGRAVVNGAFANIALTGYTLDGSSLVWASGITDSQDLPAFPSGSTITMNTVIVGNGVTYNPETETAQSVTSTDLTRTYKNTISGVTRSDSTYTFAISRAVPTITTKSGAVTGRAVVNGAFANIALTGYTLDGSSLVWASGITDSQDLPAFPSGSTITMNTVIVGNGVTYNPETETAQSVTSTDLTRTYKNTISGVTRSDSTYTFAISRAVPTITTKSGAVTGRAVVNGAFANIALTGYTLDGSSLVWASGITDSQDLPAFPSGSTITMNTVIVGNGVTYNPETETAQSVTSTDLTRTYKNTISGVTRSDSTYTFAISRAVPTITTKSGAVTGRAVVNGAFANIALTGYTLDGSSLVWASGITDSQDLPAFPSGSTITMNTVIVGNGVTYNPETETAQSVTSTDLTREMSPLSFSWSTTSQKWEATFNDSATITSGGGSRSVTVKNHNFINQLSKTANITVGYSGGKITVSGADYDNSTILLASDMVSLPQAENFVASGVTYTLAAQQFTAVKNGVQTLDSSDWEYSGSIGMEGFDFMIELADSSDVTPNTAPSGLTLNHPSDVEIGEEGGNVFNVTIDSAVVNTSASNDDIEIVFEANCEGAGRTEGEEATIGLSDNPMYITDGNNRWQLDSIDVDLATQD